jgi:hypothetical protein
MRAGAGAVPAFLINITLSRESVWSKVCGSRRQCSASLGASVWPERMRRRCKDRGGIGGKGSPGDAAVGWVRVAGCGWLGAGNWVRVAGRGCSQHGSGTSECSTRCCRDVQIAGTNPRSNSMSRVCSNPGAADRDQISACKMGIAFKGVQQGDRKAGVLAACQETAAAEGRARVDRSAERGGVPRRWPGVRPARRPVHAPTRREARGGMQRAMFWGTQPLAIQGRTRLRACGPPPLARKTG